MNNVKASLIRFATISSATSFNNEATPQIGLAYLASICKINEVEVEGIDATAISINKKFDIPKYKLKGQGIDVDEVINRIDPKTNIIGVSAMFTYEWLYVRDCIKEVKKKFPHVKVVAGGEHVTALTDYSLNDCHELDYIVLGEGEQTWTEIMIKLKDGSQNFSDIPGIVFRENEKIIRTKPRARIKEIDKIPWPDWETIPVEPYLDSATGFGPGSGRNMPMLASRGCPYACTFCESKSMWTRKVRYRSPENVIAEMKQMYNFGVRKVNFDDDTFGVSKKNIKSINDLLHQELPKMTYTCETVVQLAKDENVVKDMKRGGCTATFVGIESGNNEILKKIKKTQTTKECVQAMKNLRKHGIESHAFIMVGFPDETEETFKQTMDFIPELKPDGVIFSIFTPYPGSDIYNECKDKEIIKGDFDLVLYNHQSPLNCFTKNIPKERFYELRKEAFEFVDNYNRKAKLRRGIASLKNLGIVATWKRVYRYFYSKFLNYTIVKSS